MSMIQSSQLLARNGVPSGGSAERDVREYARTEYREKDSRWLASSCGESESSEAGCGPKVLPGAAVASHTGKRGPALPTFSENRIVRWLLPKVETVGRR